MTGCFSKSQNGFKRLVKLSTLSSVTPTPYFLHFYISTMLPSISTLQDSSICLYSCSRGADLRSDGLHGCCSVSVKINRSSIRTPAAGGWVITELVQICCLCKCCLYEERTILQLDPCLFVLNDIFLWAYSELLMLLCLCRYFHFPDTEIIDFNLFCCFGKILYNLWKLLFK